MRVPVLGHITTFWTILRRDFSFFKPLELLKTNSKSENQMQNKVTLRTCPPLAWCPASSRVTRSSLCDCGLHAWQFVCLFVSFWQPLFSQLLLCLWFSVVGMAGNGGELSLQFAIVCHHLPLWHARTHTCTRTHAETSDLVTAILAFPKLPIAI